MDMADDLQIKLEDCFRLANKNRLCHSITTGRISPWVLYHSKSGIEFLETLHEDQVSAIITYINPTSWAVMFKRNQALVNDIKNMLASIGFWIMNRLRHSTYWVMLGKIRAEVDTPTFEGICEHCEINYGFVPGGSDSAFGRMMFTQEYTIVNEGLFALAILKFEWFANSIIGCWPFHLTMRYFVTYGGDGIVQHRY